MLSSFEAIFQATQKNFNKLFKSSQVSQRENVLTKIFNNQWSNMRKVLTMWQEKRCLLEKKEIKQNNIKK